MQLWMRVFQGVSDEDESLMIQQPQPKLSN